MDTVQAISMSLLKASKTTLAHQATPVQRGCMTALKIKAKRLVKACTNKVIIPAFAILASHGSSAVFKLRSMIKRLRKSSRSSSFSELFSSESPQSVASDIVSKIDALDAQQQLTQSDLYDGVFDDAVLPSATHPVLITASEDALDDGVFDDAVLQRPPQPALITVAQDDLYDGVFDDAVLPSATHPVLITASEDALDDGVFDDAVLPSPPQATLVTVAQDDLSDGIFDDTVLPIAQKKPNTLDDMTLPSTATLKPPVMPTTPVPSLFGNIFAGHQKQILTSKAAPQKLPEMNDSISIDFSSWLFIFCLLLILFCPAFLFSSILSIVILNGKDTNNVDPLTSSTPHLLKNDTPEQRSLKQAMMTLSIASQTMSSWRKKSLSHQISIIGSLGQSMITVFQDLLCTYDEIHGLTTQVLRLYEEIITEHYTPVLKENQIDTDTPKDAAELQLISRLSADPDLLNAFTSTSSIPKKPLKLIALQQYLDRISALKSHFLTVFSTINDMISPTDLCSVVSQTKTQLDWHFDSPSELAASIRKKFQSLNQLFHQIESGLHHISAQLVPALKDTALPGVLC